MLSFVPRGVLGGILSLIGSVSEGFPSYSLVLFLTYLQPIELSHFRQLFAL